MRGVTIVGLSAGLLMALTVCAAEASTPASRMVSELTEAAGKCGLISLSGKLQQRSDDHDIQNAIDLMAIGGSKSAVDDAMTSSQAKIEANMKAFDACVISAKEEGRAAYKNYQAAPNQPQTVKDDAKAVYVAWIAALAELTTVSSSDDSMQLADYRKALSLLEVDDVEN